LLVQQDGGVGVEAHERAVVAANALTGAHDDGAVDLALLDASARRGVLHRHLDHVADMRVAALAAAQHLDAHDRTGTRVVGDVQHRLHLNHGELLSNLTRLPVVSACARTREPCTGKPWPCGQFWTPYRARRIRTGPGTIRRGSRAFRRALQKRRWMPQ